MLAEDVNGVGDDAVDGFGDHGKIGGVQEELEGGGVDLETVLEEEIHRHPWKTTHPLHPKPKTQQQFPHCLTSPDSAATVGYGHRWRQLSAGAERGE